MKGGYHRSVAEYATAWATSLAAMYPGLPEPLEAELRAEERAYLEGLGLGHLLDLADADVEHLDVSRTAFLRVAMHLTEGEFTRLVIGLALAAGVLVHHCGRARECEGGPGFPDLVLAGHHRVLFAELKRLYAPAVRWSARSAEQVTWARCLTGCNGAPYVLWTPADLIHISAKLRALNE
jgi:hypothetical protein